MKRIVLILSAGIFLLTSCNQYNNVLKSADYEYKYEAAKEYFVKGQYSRAALLFGDLIAVMKGTCSGIVIYVGNVGILRR